MRKKRKFLQTDFIKFILEKYSDQVQSDIEEPIEDDETRELRNQKLKKKPLNEVDDEEPIEDDEVDDEIIDSLLNEYKRLRMKYENSRIHNRRK
jgi:hypothetical protein